MGVARVRRVRRANGVKSSSRKYGVCGGCGGCGGIGASKVRRPDDGPALQGLSTQSMPTEMHRTGSKKRHGAGTFYVDGRENN